MAPSDLRHSFSDDLSHSSGLPPTNHSCALLPPPAKNNTTSSTADRRLEHTNGTTRSILFRYKPISKLPPATSNSTMGTGHYSRRKGARSKIKKYKRKTWLCNRAKDTDQIQDEIEKASQPGAKPADQFEYDDDLPGGGQFYCVETGKHFADAKALADHKKSRYYKRRCKEIKEEKYTQAEAEWASGMTKEKLPPAHAKK